MKKLMKHLFSLTLLLSLVAIPLITPAHGTALDVGIQDIDGSIKLGNKEPVALAVDLINFAMTLLGILAVGIILIAGFKWMTAGGSDEKLKDARKLMVSGVIGLVIILSAWGIASFILSNAVNITK